MILDGKKALRYCQETLAGILAGMATSYKQMGGSFEEMKGGLDRLEKYFETEGYKPQERVMLCLQYLVKFFSDMRALYDKLQKGSK